MKSKKMVLNTELVKVFQTEDGYVAYLKMKKGGWVRNTAYNPDLRGLIGALTLSLDALSGKIFLDRVEDAEVDASAFNNVVAPKLITGSDQ